MGVSTDGIICYGIALDVDIDLPWEDYEIEKWWREVNDFENPFPSPYSEETETGYVDGFSHEDPRTEQYIKYMDDWDKSNPVPIGIVTHCSDSYPMFILTTIDIRVVRKYVGTIHETIIDYMVEFKNLEGHWMPYQRSTDPNKVSLIGLNMEVVVFENEDAAIKFAKTYENKLKTEEANKSKLRKSLKVVWNSNNNSDV
jgi:hypothetical protein